MPTAVVPGAESSLVADLEPHPAVRPAFSARRRARAIWVSLVTRRRPSPGLPMGRIWPNQYGHLGVEGEEVDWGEIAAIVEEAYRVVTPKNLIAVLEAR